MIERKKRFWEPAEAGERPVKGKGGGPKKPKTPPKPRSLFSRLFWGLFWLAAGGVVVGGAAAWAMFGYFSQDLPSIDALKNYSPKIVTFFYSDDGRVIGEYSTERRIVVPLAKIPDHVRKAFIAAEDSNFYHHQGVDPQSIIRAFLANLEAGTTVQGGSTITQQVTRSFLLSPEKTYTRKIREAILAYRIDKYLSKDEILYLYLNHIYLGHGAYGVESAAQVYFDKHVDQLTIAEAAQLAGMPQAPSRWSPFNNPEAAERRRLYAVSRMLENGFITREQAEKADREKPTFRDRSNVNLYAAPYFAEHIRRLMVDQYGEDHVHNDGFQVYTTVNIEFDQRAHEAVARGVREFTRRRPYEGPHKQLAPEEVGPFLQRQTAEFAENPIGPGSEFEAVVTELNAKDGQIAFKAGAISGVIRKAQSQWAVKNQALNKLFKPGSVILVRAEEVKIQPKKEEPKKDGDKKKPEAKPAPEPKPEEVRTEIQYQLEAKPEVQSALMSLDLRDGAVKAMVGGRDFKESQFNRAIQSRRQPGSAFKPIIYTAAMDNGFTPGSVLIDSPIVHDDFAHGRRWKPTNYDHKFYGPTDLYTGLTQSRNVLAIKLLSKVGYPAVFDTAKKLGLTGDMPMNLSLALGSHGVSLSELVSAFSTYPNLGERVDPWFITRIVDRNGNVIQEGRPNRQRVISSGTACTILYMLKGVVEHGTGTRVKALGRPSGGKTGTTNDLSDAWFVGFTAEYVTGVWIGLDEMKRMGWGESGGQAAAPIFLYYMQDVLKGRPIQDFVPPPDAQIVTNGSSSICYKAGTVGTGISELGGGGSGDEFLKSDLEEKDM